MKQQEMVIKINPTTMFWTFALVAFVVYLNATFTYLSTTKNIQTQVRTLIFESPMIQEFKNLNSESQMLEPVTIPQIQPVKTGRLERVFHATAIVNKKEEAGIVDGIKREAKKSKGAISEAVAKVAKTNGEVVRHFSEESYVLGAIVLHGEAGAIKSKTEQSGVLWTIWNRVLDEQFPNDIPSVITQEGQFDGYTINGVYTKKDYDLAVDVFERAWREAHGESSESAGRTLPKDYLYFYGDGEHNYFVKYFGGDPYVWGSMFISPYEN